MNRIRFISAFFCFIFVFSEQITAQDAIFYKFPGNQLPVIDGYIDPVWSYVDAHFIELWYENDPYYEGYGGEPTLDMVSWRAAWYGNYLYVIVSVQDDDFYPSWLSGFDPWMSDRVEVFLDVNDNLDDGSGPSNRAGHYEIAPDFHVNEYQYTGSESTFCGYYVSNVDIS